MRFIEFFERGDGIMHRYRDVGFLVSFTISSQSRTATTVPGCAEEKESKGRYRERKEGGKKERKRSNGVSLAPIAPGNERIPMVRHYRWNDNAERSVIPWKKELSSHFTVKTHEP